MAAKDLTTGSIPLRIVQLALPVLASFLLQSAYFLADLYFVGRLGSAAIAGMAIAINTFFVNLALAMTFGIGALALISRAFGQRSLTEIPVLFQQALWMATAAGGVLALAAFLGAQRFVAFFTEDPAVLAAGTAYFRVISITLLLQLLLMVSSLCFRAVGDFLTPTALMAVGTALNVVLDPLLIFGWGPVPRLGVAGAALATVLVQALGVAAVLWLVLPRPGRVLVLRGPWRVRPALMARILRIGLPAGLQFALFALMLFVTYAAVRPFGADATAATGVGFRLLETSVLPIVSIGAAVSSLAGQNLGARRMERVRATVLWGMAFGSAIGAAEFALLAAAPLFWVGLFSADATVRIIGAEYLLIGGIGVVLMGPGNSIVALGQGLGRTLLPLAAQVIRVSAFFGFLALLLWGWEIGVTGIFWSRALSQVPELLFLLGVLGYWWGGALVDAPHAVPAPPAEPASVPTSASGPVEAG